MGNKLSKKSNPTRSTGSSTGAKESPHTPTHDKPTHEVQAKATPAASPSSSKNSTKSKASSAVEAPSVSEKKIEELFDHYAPQKDVMGPDEVMQFCEDLQVDPEDIAVLVLSWHFRAETMCYYQKKEFTSGCRTLECDTIEALRAKMPILRKEIEDSAKFKNIYEFAFLWSRENTDKKVLDIETTSDMLELLLGEQFPFSAPFRDFLQEQKSYKAVNRDQWTSFLEFCKTIEPDLSNYDENGSWPVMLDEFVSWYREKNPDLPEPASQD